METFVILVLLLDATIRVATPLLFAALAGLFSERSGVIDVGLEGKMLGAAFAAAAVASVLDSAWAGLAAGVLTSLALSLLHGAACITYRGNQVVSGMAINIAVAGLAPTLAYAWFRLGGQTPQLTQEQRFGPLALPLSETLGGIPVLGYLYGELVSGHNLLVYFAGLLLPAIVFVLYRTRFGLRLRAVGENPAALDTAGISVERLRYQALVVNGVLCGFAGTYLSLAANAGFFRDMSAGKGFLALAALVFGNWRPMPTLAACLLFAFTDALQVRMQGVPIPGIGPIPVQFIQALPYILTVVLLAGFVGRAVAPSAIGIPYTRKR
jgi:general nucleoside transport system permease protein